MEAYGRARGKDFKDTSAVREIFAVMRIHAESKIRVINEYLQINIITFNYFFQKKKLKVSLCGQLIENARAFEKTRRKNDKSLLKKYKTKLQRDVTVGAKRATIT